MWHTRLCLNKKGRGGEGKKGGAITQFCVSSLKGDTIHSFCKVTVIFNVGPYFIQNIYRQAHGPLGSCNPAKQARSHLTKARMTPSPC